MSYSDRETEKEENIEIDDQLISIKAESTDTSVQKHIQEEETHDNTGDELNLHEIDEMFESSIEASKAAPAEDESITEEITTSNKRPSEEEEEAEGVNKKQKTNESEEVPNPETEKEATDSEQTPEIRHDKGPEKNESNATPQESDKPSEQTDTNETNAEADQEKEATPTVNEKEDLEMIATELEAATESNKEKPTDNNIDPSLGEPENKENNSDKEESEKEAIYSGTPIPANSELLSTHSALAAYNALATQLPPLAGLANANLAALPLQIVAPDYLPPRIQLLINTLPTLDNLATQLLRIVALGPYQKIIDLASNPDTPAGATFRDLTSLFEFTKRLYSEEDPFLTVEHLAPGMWKEGEVTPSIFRNREQSIESTLRKVNLATFLAATLGTIEVGFFYLNESFLDVFCPFNNLDPVNALSNMGTENRSLQSVGNAIGERVGKMLKQHSMLYLDLKTQAYISAIEAGERSREEILEDILPENMQEILLARRAVKGLSPTEDDFIDRCKTRKEILLNYPSDKNISEEYGWFAFLKELFEYVSKNMGFLIWGKKGKVTATKERGRKINTPHSQETLEAAEKAAAAQAAADASVAAAAAAASRETMQRARENRPPTIPLPSEEGVDLEGPEYREITNTLLPSEIQEQQIHIRLNPGSAQKGTHRRPWTREEEKALRHALELKGPQWATILELFGHGGKISEALKNRTQVQLKDKARNWKMFFLKNGLPIPGYLQGVTGDLERDEKQKTSKTRSKKTAAAPVPSVQQQKK
ncbi:TBF1 [[Candida] subhashii]|uniref:TBF1 n=1 Tax=[Candida] subhashii TaxID=561895 RepID=A0A8J5QPA0_9ASCO|nr:TBF1 [[Candida] subhashii]KAG7663908.1 TBF1 [[Candida] subhashii]